MSARRPAKRSTTRDYPRTARLNELLREILAEAIERIDDDRLELLTVISVTVDSDLRHATVYYDSLHGEEGDEETLAALADVRWLLQKAVGREARIKRVPELTFKPDPSVRAGERIDSILRHITPADDEVPDAEATPVTGAAAPGPAADRETGRDDDD